MGIVAFMLSRSYFKVVCTSVHVHVVRNAPARERLWYYHLPERIVAAVL